MKTTLIYIYFLLVLPWFLPAVNKVNQDQPIRGQWKLHPRQLWRINDAGKDVLSMPDIFITEDDSIIVRDWKNKKGYLFTSKGQYLKTFGKPGEGPGEVKQYMGGFLIRNSYIIADLDKLHYFSLGGVYLRSIPNNVWQREPRIFLDENQFIAAPTYDVSIRDAEIQLVQMDRGIKNGLKLIPASTPEKLKDSPPVNIIGLTPQIILGYDSTNTQVIYGINNKYLIYIMDLSGNLLNSFSVKRLPMKIAYTSIRKEIELFGGDPLPPKILKQLPNQLTHFHKIEVINGLIFVYNGNFGLHWQQQQIDIFSRQGQYLYQAVFNPEPGKEIYFSRTNITIKNGHLYVVLEDEDGEVIIVKYAIDLPRAQ